MPDDPLSSFFQNARYTLSAPSWQTLPPEGPPEVALMGRSNVGKSSLLNALVGRKALAHTSGTPGKTRAFNFYALGDADAGNALYLVDLPGFGYAKFSQEERDRWARLIEQYITERQALALVLHLVDSRHDPTALDRAVFEAMRDSPVTYVVVMTKADKLSGNTRAKAVRGVKEALVAAGRGAAVVLTSAQTGRGLDEVRQWIESAATPPPSMDELEG